MATPDPDTATADVAPPPYLETDNGVDGIPSLQDLSIEGGETAVTTTSTTKKKKKNKKRKTKNKKAPVSLSPLLDGASYPHITDRIIFLLGRAAIPLRGLNRNLCTLIDRSLLVDIYQMKAGLVDNQGRHLPRTNYKLHSAIKGAPRIVTVLQECEPELPYPVDMSRARVFRFIGAPLSPFPIKTPTAVFFATVVPCFPEHWLVPTGFYMPVLKRGVRRIVYNISFTSPPLLLASNICWSDTPLHAHELVVRFDAVGPMPHQPQYLMAKEGEGTAPDNPGFLSYLPEDGAIPPNYQLVAVPPLARDVLDFHEQTMIEQLACIFAHVLRPGVKLTIVGLETIEAPYPSTSAPRCDVIPTRPLGFKKIMAMFYRRRTGVSAAVAGEDVEGAIEFLTDNQYRDRLGEEVWEIETKLSMPGFQLEVLPSN